MAFWFIKFIDIPFLFPAAANTTCYLPGHLVREGVTPVYSASVRCNFPIAIKGGIPDKKPDLLEGRLSETSVNLMIFLESGYGIGTRKYINPNN